MQQPSGPFPLRRALVPAALAVALAAVAYFVISRTREAAEPAPPALEQATFETRGEPARFALKDGSTLELAPATRVDVIENEARAVRLSLRRGRMTSDVAAGDERSFAVLAGTLVVQAQGARFEVATAEMQLGQRVDVRVERGEATVKGRSGPTKLGAGQSFHEDPPPPSGLVPPPLPPPQMAPPSASASAALPPVPDLSRASARELFERANWARRMGQAREAAEAYQALLDRFAGDQRAGLAAYELGRVRMDSLKDLAGAAQAFERSVGFSPSAPFREDALARLTQIYAETGQHADCARAQKRYLSSYPSGAQKDAVAARCGSASGP